MAEKEDKEVSESLEEEVAKPMEVAKPLVPTSRTVNFAIPCTFRNGQTIPVNFTLGNPEGTHHPLHFQSAWLASEKGGTVPPDIMKALGDLQEMAEKNGVYFPDLALYAMQLASKSGGADNDEFNKILSQK